MADSLRLGRSASACGFESHLRHQLTISGGMAKSAVRSGLKIRFQLWSEGSSPSTATIFGSVAQWLVQRSHTPLVVCSSHTTPTISNPHGAIG